MADLPFADVKVHSELATARLAQGFQLNRLIQRGVLFNVNIAGGYLDGLSSDLYARTCSVGASLESDIVLFDDDIAEKHVEMVFKSSVFGPVMFVCALAPGVTVDGQKLETGKTTKFNALPQTIVVNEVALKIEPHQNAPKPVNPAVVKTWKVGRYAVLAALFLILSLFVLDSRNYDFHIALNGPPPIYDVVAREGMNAARLEGVTTSVQEKLTELGLAEYVNASLENSGAIGLNGVIRSDKQLAWQEFQFWYDESANPVLLSRVTMAPDLNDFPPIASIKLSEPRKINLLNGTELGVGDRLSDGLTLKAIENEYIVLDSRGENITISFTGKDMNGG